MVGQQIEQPVPGNQRADQQHRIGYGMALAGHAVLRCVGDDDDHQQVGNAQRAHIAPDHEAKEQEQRPVHERAAHDGFERRNRKEEDVAPVDREIHARYPATSGPFCKDGRRGARALRSA
ncbi:hypothetical protein D3C72_1713260 [compost metagenome]